MVCRVCYAALYTMWHSELQVSYKNKEALTVERPKTHKEWNKEIAKKIETLTDVVSQLTSLKVSSTIDNVDPAPTQNGTTSTPIPRSAHLTETCACMLKAPAKYVAFVDFEFMVLLFVSCIRIMLSSC